MTAPNPDPLTVSPEEQAARVGFPDGQIAHFLSRCGKAVGRREEHSRRIRERWLWLLGTALGAAVLLAWTWFR